MTDQIALLTEDLELERRANEALARRVDEVRRGRTVILVVSALVTVCIFGLTVALIASVRTASVAQTERDAVKNQLDCVTRIRSVSDAAQSDNLVAISDTLTALAAAQPVDEPLTALGKARDVLDKAADISATTPVRCGIETGRS